MGGEGLELGFLEWSQAVVLEADLALGVPDPIEGVVLGESCGPVLLAGSEEEELVLRYQEAASSEPPASLVSKPASQS